MASLIGLFTLGRDAELRTTGQGEQVASLALAYHYGRKEGGKRPTQWVDAALWGERAAKLAEYLTKGSEFYMQVEDVHVETYDKRDGTKGIKLVGRVGAVEFTRGKAASSAPAAPAPAPRAPAPAPKPASGFDDMDDDIPF